LNYLPIINALGIRHHNNITNGWLQCHCTSGIHKDENPSMGIHLESGIVNCFACGLSTNIYKLIQNKLNISYKKAIEYVHGEDNNEVIPRDATSNLKKVDVVKNEIIKTPVYNYNFISIPLSNPNAYMYTICRGFSKEFCEEFNIKICLSGLYYDYMIIPIIDIEQQFASFEARKINQCEQLCMYYKDIKTPNSELQSKFDLYRKECKQTGKELSHTEKWIAQTKVLYPAGHKVNITIFNIDNLIYNEDLILVEGIGSIPKIYENISKNVTAIFGANLSNEQLMILKRFKKNIIVLSDNDRASYSLISKMNKHLSNVKVFNCETEDTKKSFVEDIKTSTIVSAAQFLVEREYFIYDL
jgi:5S rRNA maturation endonuclease (ribonuclease M5)